MIDQILIDELREQLKGSLLKRFQKETGLSKTQINQIVDIMGSNTNKSSNRYRIKEHAGQFTIEVWAKRYRLFRTPVEYWAKCTPWGSPYREHPIPTLDPLNSLAAAQEQIQLFEAAKLPPKYHYL